MQPAPTVITLGKKTVGGSSDSFAPDRKRVSAYALATGGTISKLTIYLAPGGAAGQQVLKGVVYADAGGSPGSLLASSNEFTYTSSALAGWYDLTLAHPLAVQPGRYWIGVITGAATHVAGFRYDSVANARDISANTYTAGPSDPFGSFSTDGEEMSLYATVARLELHADPAHRTDSHRRGAQSGQPFVVGVERQQWRGGLHDPS